MSPLQIALLKALISKSGMGTGQFQANIPAVAPMNGVHVSNPIGTFNPGPAAPDTAPMMPVTTPGYTPPTAPPATGGAHRAQIRARVEKFAPRPKPDVGMAGMMAGRPEPPKPGGGDVSTPWAEQSRDARMTSVDMAKQRRADWAVARQMYEAATSDKEREKWLKRMQDASADAQSFLK